MTKESTFQEDQRALQGSGQWIRRGKKKIRGLNLVFIKAREVRGFSGGVRAAAVEKFDREFWIEKWKKGGRQHQRRNPKRLCGGGDQ